MSYYWFNKQELLKKVKEKYHNNGGNEKAAKYYLDNKDIFIPISLLLRSVARYSENRIIRCYTLI